jgi:hypothetical protein
VLLSHLDDFLRASTQIHASWDAYADEHTGPDGWPLDERAYGLRQRQRDADIAAAFEAVRPGASALLDTASEQLASLPARPRSQPWNHQLAALRAAAAELGTLHGAWRRTLASLPDGAGPGLPAYDEALAEHYAECWSDLDTWALYGPALIKIDAAATQHNPPPGSPPAPPAPGTGPRRKGR